MPLHRLPVLLSIFILAFVLIASSASGQWVNVHRIFYSVDDANNRPVVNPSYSTFNVRPMSEIYRIFGLTASSGADAVTAWQNTLESDQLVLLGKGSTRVRAWDISEDYDYNIFSPNNTGDAIYWSDFNVNYASNGAIRGLRNIVNGPHAGESVINNNDILALMDDMYLFFDPPDSTLSLYWLQGSTSGTLRYDFTWSTFSAGTFAGQTLESCLQYMIGAEEQNLFFLLDDSTIVQYQLNYGNLDAVTFKYEFEYILPGPLAGYTLKQLIDGDVPDYTYVGWDNGPIVVNVQADFRPIPEPSAVLLSLAATSALIRRRRTC